MGLNIASMSLAAPDAVDSVPIGENRAELDIVL
jgi:hypothetical protein